MLIGYEVELENQTSFVLCVFVNSRSMPMFRKRSNICCMDFFVLTNSIERNTYHSHDVLLAHLLITAVLVSWSFFLKLVKRLAERLSVCAGENWSYCLRTLQIYQGSQLSNCIYSAPATFIVVIRSSLFDVVHNTAILRF